MMNNMKKLMVVLLTVALLLMAMPVLAEEAAPEVQSSIVDTQKLDASYTLALNAINAEDYDLYYKLEETGKVIHLDMIQYIQRNHPNSISLNANSYKAAVWHSYACIKAMQRRGIEDESLMLFPVEHALKKAYLQGYEKATSSRVYRLGLFLASPVLFLARLWRR